MSAHNEPFRAMSFSKDGKSLITTSAAGEIKYWSETIAPLHSVYSHDNTSVNEITFSPNSAKFATAGDDCKVNVWDWETSRSVKHPNKRGALTAKDDRRETTGEKRLARNTLLSQPFCSHRCLLCSHMCLGAY